MKTIRMINLLISILTYLILFGGNYFFNCDFSGLSGAVSCSISSPVLGIIEYVFTLAIISFFMRMFTFFTLDFWALYFLYTLVTKKNEKTV